MLEPNSISTFRTVLILSTAMLLTASCSCNREKEEKTAACKATGDKFFQLCDYMNATIDDYRTAGYKVNKTVTLNDHSESHSGMEVNWQTELQPIAAAYINRSAWLDDFQTDTTNNDDGYSVLYASFAANIPIKELEISFTAPSGETEVSAIRVKTSRKNLLYTSNQEIDFVPGSYYEVRGKQRTLFLSKTDFSVRSDIIGMKNAEKDAGINEEADEEENEPETE